MLENNLQLLQDNMSKTQNFPIGNTVKPEVVQRNLSDLFLFAHEHVYRTTEPVSTEGAPGDIALVNLDGLTFLYCRYPDPLNWQRTPLIESSGGYDDIRTPGTSVRLGASAPSLVAFAGSGTLYVPAFGGVGPVQEVFFSIQMPHSWSEGSPIYPHIHWSPVNGNSGNVKWNLEYTKASVNGVFGTPTTLSAVDPASGTAWSHQVIGFGEVDMTDHKISTMLHCRIWRDSSDAQDTYTSDAAFLEVDFHFKQDSIGSSEPFVK